MKGILSDERAMPTLVDRAAFQTEVDALRVREKAHTHGLGDALVLSPRLRSGWPQRFPVDGSNTRTNGRPTAQWSRVKAGHSDNLGGPRQQHPS